MHSDTDAAPMHGLMPEGRAMLHSPARTALRQAAAALDEAERYKQPLEMCLALAQMARCYRGLQALGPAERYLEQALALGAHPRRGRPERRDPVPAGGNQLFARPNCMRATTRAAAMQRWSARAIAPSRPPAWPARVSDPQWEIKVLLRISDVLDRCGDHDDAVELQSRAMRLMYGDCAEPAAR